MTTLTERIRNGSGEVKRLRAENRELRAALRGFDTFAWSMVSLPEAARKNLQAKIDRARALLAAKEQRT